MATRASDTLEGGCTCRHVRYRLEAAPILVHCCHCSWCQRETGSAFVVNALVEADRVALLQGEVALVHTPSASGKGQRIARCPHCQVAVWSHYPGGGGDAIRFVRAGTLDAPDRVTPDIHVYTSTRLPWVRLPDCARAFDEFYDPRQEWSPETLARWRAAKQRFGEG